MAESKKDLDDLGWAMQQLATALKPLSPDQRRRVLMACLVLLGEPVPWEMVKPPGDDTPSEDPSNAP